MLFLERHISIQLELARALPGRNRPDDAYSSVSASSAASPGGTTSGGLPASSRLPVTLGGHLGGHHRARIHPVRAR